MRLFGTLAALVAVALLVPFWWPGPPTPADGGRLPWQIETFPGGRSRVIGLDLPGSSFGDARRLFGREFEVALIASPDGRLSVEAYQADARLGFITGKLILTLAPPEPELAALAARATRSEVLRSGARRAVIAGDDLPAAERWLIRAVGFVPTVNLDESVVLKRFGAPAERVPAGVGAEHLLYPQFGLDLLLDREGKEFLQYVAPAEFAALRAPLLCSTDAPGAPTAADCEHPPGEAAQAPPHPQPSAQ